VYNKAYINKQVLFDILSAVLKQPSVDGVLRMLTHISLIQDPCALIYILDNVLAALPPNLDITALEQEQEKLKANKPDRSSLCAQGSPPSNIQKLGTKAAFN